MFTVHIMDFHISRVFRRVIPRLVYEQFLANACNHKGVPKLRGLT